ncbi:hypothetical protein ACU61A_15645 [Pseudonocardia sichuanensis]
MTAPGGPIVEFIVGQSGMAERLLAQHVDDGTGHCRVCSAGPQAGRKVWPCPIRVVTEEAAAQAAKSARASGPVLERTATVQVP